ncbi:MAG TPA: SSI family serine proteinase inhibitor [Gaiellaceae bacterium]|nr:SSI family serine proteinase inhibitor [Gaiellaceae bacterium]
MHAAAALTASLTIVVFPAGTKKTLTCAPAGGTVANPSAACRKLSALDAPFAPVPEGTACTQLHGGDATAIVRGTFRGRRVWARFDLRNGCEIARWRRLSFLLGPS